MLIINKGIERRGRIGPLYVHEALLLALFGMASFFGLVVGNMLFKISRWWILSCPSLLFLMLMGLMFFRKGGNPTYIYSWFAFYKQPKYLDTKSGKLCYKIDKTNTI